MNVSGNFYGNHQKINVFLLALWIFLGIVSPDTSEAVSFDAPADIAVAKPVSTGDFWLQRQNNPFFGGRNWNQTPEWIKQKGPVGVPNPRSGGTGGDFVSGTAQAPGYKPGGSVPKGPGVRTPVDVYDDWRLAGNKSNVPAGKGVRPPESISGVTEGTSAGSQWFKNQKNPFIGGSGKGWKGTPFTPGKRLTGEAKTIYDRLLKEGFPHRAPPSGLSPVKGSPSSVPSSGVPSAGAAGEGAMPAPKSGMSPAAKVLTGIMIINSIINIGTSDNPKEQAKEEARGWFTGIIGNIMGGLITGGPIGGIIGAITSVTVTDPTVADHLMGNNPQIIKDLESEVKHAGPKMIEGQMRIASEKLKESLPEGFKPIDITPPGTGTSAGTADIGSSGIPGGNSDLGQAPIGASPEFRPPPDITPPGTGTSAGTADIGSSGMSGNQSQPPNGASPGLEWAQTINVNQSYQGGVRSKAKDKAKENLKTAGSTTSERITAGEGENQKQKGIIVSQGMETNQGISNTQQEGKKATDTNRIMSETAIGTIVAGGFMGGLNSGVAVGLDSLFGTVGRGAGSQVSVTAGLSPPKPPHTQPPTGIGEPTVTGNTTGTGEPAVAGDATGTGSGTPTGTANPPSEVKTITCTGTFSGTAISTAGYGKRGQVRCSYTAQWIVTLLSNGSASAATKGGFRAVFDDRGNGLSCAPNSAVQLNLTGTHGNGRVTLNAPNRLYSGQYTNTAMTASGGGSGNATLDNGSPVFHKVAGSANLTCR